MQSQWKLSRAHGIANLMVIHRLSDLDAVGDARSEARAVAAGLLADCSTRIVYRQETDQLAGTARALGLTDTERDLLPAPAARHRAVEDPRPVPRRAPPAARRRSRRLRHRHRHDRPHPRHHVRPAGEVRS